MKLPVFSNLSDVGELNSTMQKGDIIGHEAIGYVEEVGHEVKKVQKGDRVINLPVICCGDCLYCDRQASIENL
jgi:threonine dehydrogenase-like Zn-dependent dehydrogenase